jgi:putative flavoprotein involved in K+ transport
MATATLDTLVIGAGQAGLAVSWHLQTLGIDHVVLDRGRIAERWRSERWDSLRTLTPNWMTRLPGLGYHGADPDGFMRLPELVGHFEAYARSFAAPVVEGARVESVTGDGERFLVRTGGGRWRARSVVVATGWNDRPAVPELAARIPRRVQQLATTSYRRPDQVLGDRVLVVGASASGSQIACELAAAGRQVTLAVGRHTRLPRRYRGHDVMWWLDRLGVLDRPPTDDDDRRRLMAEPSPQLSGTGPVDLRSLQGAGVTLAGRLTDVANGRAFFADDLRLTVAEAEERLRRVLATIDARADRLGGSAPEPVAPPVDVRRAPTSAALGFGSIDAVVWATGFRRAYPWLQVPVLDAHGEIRHEGGLTPVPGVFVVGMRFQSSRRSTFIDGARLDAEVVARAVARRAGVALAA